MNEGITNIDSFNCTGNTRHNVFVNVTYLIPTAPSLRNTKLIKQIRRYCVKIQQLYVQLYISATSTDCIQHSAISHAGNNDCNIRMENSANDVRLPYTVRGNICTTAAVDIRQANVCVEVLGRRAKNLR